MFRYCIIILLLSYTQIIIGQNAKPNIIIICTDGLRWQEVFKGIDSQAIRIAPKFKSDSTFVYAKYADNEPSISRKKLLPFLWNKISKDGQIFGNREFQNNFNVSNPYQFSYPGYSELICGFVDSAINTNSYRSNPNDNLFDFLSKQKEYKNKIAVFGAWNVFDSVFHADRAAYPVFAAFKPFGNKSPNSTEQIINKMNASALKFFGNDECLDVFTHYAAMDYLKNKKPKALFIGYGETDEWAHNGRYQFYVNAANQVDDYISQIWNFVEQDKQYKNNTILIVTADHGRGNNKNANWMDHNKSIAGSGELWFAIIGKNITPNGENKNATQLYLKQLVPSILEILGYKNYLPNTTPIFFH